MLLALVQDQFKEYVDPCSVMQQIRVEKEEQKEEEEEEKEE